MQNIKAEIYTQQKYLDTQLCDCTDKNQCPLNGQYLTESIVYQTNITANIPGYKEKFTLAYLKLHFKFAMVTTKNHLRNNIIKMIRSYLRCIERLNNKKEYPE